MFDYQTVESLQENPTHCDYHIPAIRAKKKHDAYGPNLMSLTKSLLQWPVNLSILWSKIYTLGLENLSFCREVYMRPSVNLPQNHFCDHSPWEQALLSGLEIIDRFDWGKTSLRMQSLSPSTQRLLHAFP
jgi:hypothetical protein